MTLFERLGGSEPLRAIVTDFYRRVLDDVMIGYMFRKSDPARLIELEVQFTARALGAVVAYEGRTMRGAHAALRIQSGHFDRRHQILTETLRDHAVDPEVQEAWLGHSRALRRAVLAGPEVSECAAPGNLKPELLDRAPAPRPGT